MKPDEGGVLPCQEADHGVRLLSNEDHAIPVACHIVVEQSKSLRQ